MICSIVNICQLVIRSTWPESSAGHFPWDNRTLVDTGVETRSKIAVLSLMASPGEDIIALCPTPSLAWSSQILEAFLWNTLFCLVLQSIERLATTAGGGAVSMSSEAETALMELAEDWLHTALVFGCASARKRSAEQLAPSDLTPYFERTWCAGLLLLRPWVGVGNAGLWHCKGATLFSWSFIGFSCWCPGISMSQDLDQKRCNLTSEWQLRNYIGPGDRALLVQSTWSTLIKYHTSGPIENWHHSMAFVVIDAHLPMYRTAAVRRTIAETSVPKSAPAQAWPHFMPNMKTVNLISGHEEASFILVGSIEKYHGVLCRRHQCCMTGC